MTVITVAREFGAGGSSVAAILARRLGLEVVDKTLVGEVARRAALPPDAVEEADERVTPFVERLAHLFAPLAPAYGVAWAPPYVDPSFDPRREVLRLTEEVLREAANRGDVVIVGRGGAFVLADHRGALHVFLHAPADVRLRTVMERFSLTEPDARRRMHETDANRAAYMEQVYGGRWRDPVRYDLMVNTARLGLDGAADAIVAAAHAVAGQVRTPGLA
jgi:cytidylate kinase